MDVMYEEIEVSEVIGLGDSSIILPVEDEQMESEPNDVKGVLNEVGLDRLENLHDNSDEIGEEDVNFRPISNNDSKETRKLKHFSVDLDESIHLNEKKEKLTQLPISRVKNIMKLDKDIPVISQDVVFLVTKATELFIKTLARDSYAFTVKDKKKTIQMRHVESAIAHKDYLTFLEGNL